MSDFQLISNKFPEEQLDPTGKIFGEVRAVEPKTKSVYYSDIHFLCKFVKINAIELFLRQKQFSNQDKKRLLQYSNKIACFLFMDELDLENLDGNYFLDQDELDRVRHKLISKVSPLNYNEDKLSKYIENQLEVF